MRELIKLDSEKGFGDLLKVALTFGKENGCSAMQRSGLTQNKENRKKCMLSVQMFNLLAMIVC